MFENVCNNAQPYKCSITIQPLHACTLIDTVGGNLRSVRTNRCSLITDAPEESNFNYQYLFTLSCFQQSRFTMSFSRRKLEENVQGSRLLYPYIGEPLDTWTAPWRSLRYVVQLYLLPTPYEVSRSVRSGLLLRCRVLVYDHRI